MSTVNTNAKNEVNVEGEKRYEEVYGDTFALYSRKEMEEFIEPFIVRFKRNGLDAESIFKGKKCFDAGCGNGRGTLFMLMNGAKHVTSYDFCEKNIESTKKFVSDFGYDQVDTKQGTLESIPFKDESFDFVWCNGVLMHTDHPNQCLSEVSRILKVGGKSWIYIYGAGGVYWRIIHHLRALLKDTPIQKTISTLKMMRYPTRYIAEFIDDWYATNLRAYTNKDLSERLLEVGYENPDLLKYGMDYDTSHRRNSFTSDEEQILMGEGDLRYLLTKNQHTQNNNKLISEGEYGSSYEWPSEIIDRIDPLFARISELVENKKLLCIAVAAYIQRELRILLDCDQIFNMKDIENVINNANSFANELIEL